MSTTDPRPDPDALLARVRREELSARRGRLRIYFGACAGVGKTYAMLSAARKLAAEGVEVVVGLVETHGRAETDALLQGLPQLSRRLIEYRGRQLTEFDLDGALARKPQLILVDELAHSNVPGLRHPKRWQDVQELLDAGIDVFSTLNVQHLESLNDVVGGITNIRVWETVPDTVFDAAEEVVLVDIPAEELLERLRAGKVYLPQAAASAAGHFFRRGNLMALRELALRRTADRVEDDVQAYRSDQSIEPVWKTDAALLTCVGPGAGAERIVRSAARLAGQLNVGWHAIYVETPALQRLPAARREQILTTLNLAQELGATTAVIAHADVAASVIGYAREHNLSRVVIGRDARRRLWPWQRSQGQRLALLAPDIDLVEIGRLRGGLVQSDRVQGRGLHGGRIHGDHADGDVAPSAAQESDGEAGARRARKRLRYLWTAAACVLVTVSALPLANMFDRTNIVALYLLTVVLVGVRLGRGPAALAAVLSVGAFDFFFVPPRISFAISDVQYLLTFAVMLVVGLIAGQLTAGLRFQARVASHREQRARALYEFARDLSAAMQPADIVRMGNETVRRVFRAQVSMLMPGTDGKLRVGTAQEAPAVDLAIAQWAFDHGQSAGFGTDTLPGTDTLYVPLRAGSPDSRGVLAIRTRNRRLLRIPEQRQLLDTFAALISIALERIHYAGVAQQAVVHMESERLRNSLLAALSHDLRTPLTAMVGLTESLFLTQPPLSAAQVELLGAIREEARRMSALVHNLLDMARIESGEVRLNLQWQPLEEVIGSAIRAAHAALDGRRVEVRIPPDLPWTRFDAVLIERVLVNLLENAGKYTPPGSAVRISAGADSSRLRVCVEDEGPGFTPGSEDAMFEKFTRGDRESAKPGVGLGLAICRAIVRAHQGEIAVQSGRARGAAVCFWLPSSAPPPELDDD